MFAVTMIFSVTSRGSVLETDLVASSVVRGAMLTEAGRITESLKLLVKLPEANAQVALKLKIVMMIERVIIFLVMSSSFLGNKKVLSKKRTR